MIAHVVIHKISERDYHWIVKDFYDSTVDSGHSRQYVLAKKDGRAARNDYIKRVKEQQNAAGHLKPKHA